MLPDLPKLRQLNLNHCKLLDSGASSLAAVLPALPRLESLQMNVAGLKGGKGTLLLAQVRGLGVRSACGALPQMLPVECGCSAADAAGRVWAECGALPQMLPGALKCGEGAVLLAHARGCRGSTRTHLASACMRAPHARTSMYP